MKFYEAPYYSESQIEQLEDLHYPYSDKNAVYIGKEHQYELTQEYFMERGYNLLEELHTKEPDKIKHFLADLRRKFYTKIYTTNKSSRSQLNYIIAKRGINGFTPYEYRQAFLDAMFVQGCYMLDNGDISSVSGVDFDTMQNISADVMRNQERDFHKDAIDILKTLGLRYFGRYKIIPQGNDW